MGDIGLSVETSYTARQIWANHVIQGLQTAATMPKAEPAASDTAVDMSQLHEAPDDLRPGGKERKIRSSGLSPGAKRHAGVNNLAAGTESGNPPERQLPLLPDKPADGDDQGQHGARTPDLGLPQTQLSNTPPSHAMGGRTTEATPGDGFSSFRKFPAELRTHIWQQLLREDDGPALLPYKPGCLELRNASKVDSGLSRTITMLCTDIDAELLDKTQVALPLARVNREARDITLSEMRRNQHVSELPLYGDHCCSVFARLFEPGRDVLYIEADKANRFSRDPFELAMRQQRPIMIESSITQLALPGAFFRSLEGSTFKSIMRAAPHAHMVLVVVGEQPQWKDNGLKVQRRWVVRDAGDYRLSWSSGPGHQGFKVGQGCQDIAEFEWIKDTCDNWPPKSLDLNAFEIRPVYATRQGA